MNTTAVNEIKFKLIWIAPEPSVELQTLLGYKTHFQITSITYIRPKLFFEGRKVAPWQKTSIMSYLRVSFHYTKLLLYDGYFIRLYTRWVFFFFFFLVSGRARKRENETTARDPLRKRVRIDRVRHHTACDDT